MRPLIVFLLLGAVFLAIREIRAMVQDPSSKRLSKQQRGYRTVGMTLVVACFSMILRGTYLPVPHKSGLQATRQERQSALHYVEYWCVAGLLALPLIPLAILDSRPRIKHVLKDGSELIKTHKELVALQEEILASESPDKPNIFEKP